MSGCRVLIIDDDRDDGGFLTEALAQSGVNSIHHVYTVMQAFIYLEALEPTYLPKLIITDHYLPGIKGTEFLKDLKGMDKYKQIPVIVLSTITTSGEIEKYKGMGALDYVDKPSTYAEYFELAAEMKRKADLVQDEPGDSA